MESIDSRQKRVRILDRTTSLPTTQGNIDIDIRPTRYSRFIYTGTLAPSSTIDVYRDVGFLPNDFLFKPTSFIQSFIRITTQVLAGSVELKVYIKELGGSDRELTQLELVLNTTSSIWNKSSVYNVWDISAQEGEKLYIQLVSDASFNAQIDSNINGYTIEIVFELVEGL